MSSCKTLVMYTDINATVSKYKGIMNDLLPSHGLTGCDTVAICYDIVKPTAINTLRTRKYPLDLLGNISSSVEPQHSCWNVMDILNVSAQVLQKQNRIYWRYSSTFPC